MQEETVGSVGILTGMRNQLGLLVALFLIGGKSWGQPAKIYYLDTVAGTGSSEARASEVPLTSPTTIAVSRGTGALYVGGNAASVKRIGVDGSVSSVPFVGVVFGVAADPMDSVYTVVGPLLTITGTRAVEPQSIYFTAGQIPGLRTSVNLTSVGVDNQGNVVAMDAQQGLVFRVSASRQATIFAGSGSPAGPFPNPPAQVAISPGGKVYATLRNSGAARIEAGGIVRIAGRGGELGDPVAGPNALASPFRAPEALAVDSKERVYIADANAKVVVRVNEDGSLEQILTNVSAKSLAVDGQDRLYYLDGERNSVWRLEADGSKRLIAGEAQPPVLTTGRTTNLNAPGGVALAPNGDLFISDTGNQRILRLKPNGAIELVAGDGTLGDSGDGGPAIQAKVRSPQSLATDETGNLYVLTQSRVRRISPSGMIDAYAGGGTGAGNGDGGPARNAKLIAPSGLAYGNGRLFISDTGSMTVRAVDANGMISTYAGNGKSDPTAKPFSGLATETELNGFFSISTNKDGNLVIADGVRFRWGIVTADGRIQNYFVANPAGTSACLSDPFLQVTATGNQDAIYAAQRNICSVDRNGVVTTVMPGSDKTEEADETLSINAGGSGGGPFTSGPDGVIYFAVPAKNVIRRLTPQDPATVTIPSVTAEVGAAGSRRGVPAVVAPGALRTVFGWFLAPPGTATPVAAKDLRGGSLPTVLENVCVLVGGRKAFLTFVGTNQINYQVPALGGETTTNVQVVRNCGGAKEGASNRVPVSVARSTPELLYWTAGDATTHPVVAVDATTREWIARPGSVPGLKTRGAKIGDLITIYGISFGPTTPAVEPGQAATGAAIVPNAEVFVNSNPIVGADLLYVGASPGIAGLYQVNIRMPAGLIFGAAREVEIVVKVGGGAQTSSEATIYVTP